MTRLERRLKANTLLHIRKMSKQVLFQTETRHLTFYCFLDGFYPVTYDRVNKDFTVKYIHLTKENTVIDKTFSFPSPY